MRYGYHLVAFLLLFWPTVGNAASCSSSFSIIQGTNNVATSGNNFDGMAYAITGDLKCDLDEEILLGTKASLIKTTVLHRFSQETDRDIEIGPYIEFHPSDRITVSLNSILTNTVTHMLYSDHRSSNRSTALHFGGEIDYSISRQISAFVNYDHAFNQTNTAFGLILQANKNISITVAYNKVLTQTINIGDSASENGLSLQMSYQF